MIKAVKGMEDVLPDSSWKWEAMERILRQHFFEWGFQEIRTPVVEPLELFVRGVGEVTDIVSKEMYTLKDRNDQELALRPEGTAPTVRAIIEHEWMAQRESEKVYYLGPYFRYEKPQKGRLRQFHQYGVEVFGSPEPMVDAEVIAMFWSLYHDVGRLPKVSCAVNSIGCPVCAPKFREALLAYLKPRREKYCADCHKRMDHNPMRVFDCKVESCRRLNEAAPKTLDCLCRECDEHFGKVRSQLSGLNVPFEVNGFLVRGIDYYQRTTVEFASEDLGAQSALGGGGRYDSLFQQLGAKQPVPSMGYAGGVERLLLSLEAASFWKNRERGRSLFICHMGEQARGQTLALALKWRKLGWDVHYIYSDRALKAQLKQADRLRCRYCLFLGDRELEAGKAPLKRLADGHQVDVSLSSDEWLKELTRT